MKTDRTPGNLNRNQQLLVAQTAWPGSDANQDLWVVQCMAPRAADRTRPGEPCGHMYGVDSSDFFQRKCPACQGGPPGLVIRAHLEERPSTLAQPCISPQASPPRDPS